MDVIDQVLAGLVALLPVAKDVLAVLGSLLVVATVIVKASPTKKDDAILDKAMAIPVVGPLISALLKFSVLSRK